jgi:putative transposase
VITLGTKQIKHQARETGDSRLTKMPQSFTNLIYHIVFATKNRQPIITDDVKSRLYDYIGGTIRKQGGIALAINGMSDHVHILAKLRPDKAVSDVLRDLKANSSGWMHEVFPELKEFFVAKRLRCVHGERIAD